VFSPLKTARVISQVKRPKTKKWVNLSEDPNEEPMLSAVIWD